jgi:hypothetical protein
MFHVGPLFTEISSVMSVMCIFASSPCTLKYFLVFWEHAERVKNTEKEIFTFNNAWELKRDSISKN